MEDLIYKQSPICELINVLSTKTDDYTISYLHHGVEDNNHLLINLKTYTGSLKNKAYTISITKPKKQIKEELHENFGVDIDIMLNNMLINEAKIGTTNAILYEMRKKAQLNKPIYLGLKNKFLSWLYSLIGKTYKIKHAINNPEELLSIISLYDNRMYKDTSRGPSNFIIVNGKLAAILECTPKFVYSSDKTTLDVSSLYQLGYINNLRVIVDPNLTWNNDNILIGRGVTGKNVEENLYLIFKENSITIDENDDLIKLNQPVEIIGISDNTKHYYNIINTDIKFNI